MLGLWRRRTPPVSGSATPAARPWPHRPRACRGTANPRSAEPSLAASRSTWRRRSALGRAVLEGERKQVTVLFADVMGSMDLAEQHRSGGVAADHGSLLRDPLRGRSPLRGHGRQVHRRRHHGVVRRADRARGPRAARLLGGAARCRSELAAYAAELRREQGLSFSVRMGINSGEVVVGAIGEDLRMDYTAIGHTVGLAQRMESARRARQGLSDRAHGVARGGLPRARRPRRVRGQGRQ